MALTNALRMLRRGIYLLVITMLLHSSIISCSLLPFSKLVFRNRDMVSNLLNGCLRHVTSALVDDILVYGSSNGVFRAGNSFERHRREVHK